MAGVNINSLYITPPLLNASCPWASTRKDIQALYDCENTGGVTTRTSLPHAGIDQVASFTHALFDRGESSINAYGYSQYPLQQYIQWVKDVRAKCRRRKPVIFSVTGSVEQLRDCIGLIQAYRKTDADTGIEVNLACPNIPNIPPPAYSPTSLKPYLDMMSTFTLKDPTLTIGLKMAPYTYETQFTEFHKLVSEYKGVIAFLTCCNTLGTGFVLNDRLRPAIPTGFGGLGGSVVHPLACGNVAKFKSLFGSDLVVIGVGGCRDGRTYWSLRQAGAQCVEVATALGADGVAVFDRICKQGQLKVDSLSRDSRL